MIQFTPHEDIRSWGRNGWFRTAAASVELRTWDGLRPDYLELQIGGTRSAAGGKRAPITIRIKPEDGARLARLINKVLKEGKLR